VTLAHTGQASHIARLTLPGNLPTHGRVKQAPLIVGSILADRRYERTVRAPNGREWHVQVSHHRWPGPPSERAAAVIRELAWMPYVGFLIRPIAAAARGLVTPVVQATVGQRPWIQASAERPAITMVWRATGRENAQVAVDEIADALARGEDRPVPLSARWVGYHRGWLRLRPRLRPKG
jgi:hypothetical protein